MTPVHIDSNNAMYHVHQARAQGGAGFIGGGGGANAPTFRANYCKIMQFFFTPNSL